METMKEKWICPDAQVQVFTPQEYCLACGDEQGYTMYAYCDNTKYQINIVYTGEGDRWHAYAEGFPGQYNLEQDKSDPSGKSWVFDGSILDDHHDTTTQFGEWVGLDATAISMGKEPGDPYYQHTDKIRYCSHEPVAAGSTHHHLERSTIYKNLS